MRPERAGEAEEGIFPDGDAQAGAQEGGARQGTGGGWQTPVFLAAVGHLVRRCAGKGLLRGSAACGRRVLCREETEKGTSLPEQEVPPKISLWADAV